jgi:ATP-dependent helicase/nuclease subunit A
VFYVAATRSRKRLHVLGFARTLAPGALNPPHRTRSLLGRAWDVARPVFEAAVPLEAAAANDLGYRQHVRTLDLAALDVQVAAPPAPPRPPASPVDPPRFDWASETAIHVGTVTHRWLQRIGEEGIERWGAARVAGLAPVIAKDLELRGIPASEREAAVKRVTSALAAATTDERGRWVLGSHPESRFEYRLRVATPDGVRLIVIDRLLTDASGRRWIVDYKTSAHEGGGLEAFLDNELERYAPQLARYLGAFPSEKATAALYFPLVRGWRELA